MKKIIQLLLFIIVSLSLNGCSYKIVKNQPNTMNQNTTTNIKSISVVVDDNGEDGFSLSILGGNSSTCVWTYEGGSASVPYSTTTQTNTIVKKHKLAFAYGEIGSYSNFHVTCVDDFGSQYTGIFPTPTYYTPIDNQRNEISKNNNLLVNKYGASLLQIGGVGSRIVQKTAYLLDEHGYLSEDLISYFFNTPADILTAECQEGFRLTSCESNSKNNVFTDDALGWCRMVVEDKMQNRLQITCEK